MTASCENNPQISQLHRVQREGTEIHREIKEAGLFSRFSVNVHTFSERLSVSADFADEWFESLRIFITSWWATARDVSWENVEWKKAIDSDPILCIILTASFLTHFSHCDLHPLDAVAAGYLQAICVQ